MNQRISNACFVINIYPSALRGSSIQECQLTLISCALCGSFARVFTHSYIAHLQHTQGWLNVQSIRTSQCVLFNLKKRVLCDCEWAVLILFLKLQITWIIIVEFKLTTDHTLSGFYYIRHFNVIRGGILPRLCRFSWNGNWNLWLMIIISATTKLPPCIIHACMGEAARKQQFSWTTSFWEIIVLKQLLFERSEC